MELDVIKKLIKKHTPYHADVICKSMISERYYRNKNDILMPKKEKTEDGTDNPIRNADNRIPSNFHGLLVNQKASYMFTAPPLFDIGNADANKRITEVLGDTYAKSSKDLCINASNSGVSWLHYWINNEKKLEYGVVDSKQVIPVWSSSLNKKLLGVLRVYDSTDDEGEAYTVYEYWNETECQAFRKKTADTVDEGIESYAMFFSFAEDIQSGEMQDTYKHDFGRVPFIPFFNNNICTSDLDNIKGLIDTYDKVFSGFINDLEDIQEIIFVLSGYGGSDLAEFLQDLKKYKTVKLDETEEKPGLSTLTIDIPVEAREKLLTMTRKAIFEQGQGVDPDPQNFGNASGVALKYLYSLLELKAGLMETEFKLGFGEFIRAICQYLKVDCKSIIQTWTRTAITNDTELATIASSSVGVVSNKTILKNHPWVEDADQEEKQLKKEHEEAADEADQYKDTFNQEVNKDGNEE
jgi:SPP1 family phage portal protein